MNAFDGKKIYDRVFLLNLQFHSLSLRKPTCALPTFILPKECSRNQNAENVYRFRCILNMLNYQNLNTLIGKLTNLNINTEEKLNGITYAIIEKSIDNPNFGDLYAKLCLPLAEICVPSTYKPEKLQFLQALTTSCQIEFEKEISNELQREKKVKAIDSAEIEKCDELSKKLEVEKKIIYNRIWGILMLMSQLFKLNMLSQLILNECVDKLLSLEDEKSVECLCILLLRAGKELDEVKDEKSAKDAKTPADRYIAQIQRIVFRRYTSENTLAKLKDLISLKKNNWNAKGG